DLRDVHVRVSQSRRPLQEVLLRARRSDGPAQGIPHAIIESVAAFAVGPALVYLAPEGGGDAETEELADGNSGYGAGGGPLRDPLGARKRLRQQAEGEERSAPSSQGAWEVAPWWSRSSPEGSC